MDPSKDELKKCRDYVVLGAGYAYWNPETKQLHEYDRNMNFIRTEISEKCPSKTSMYHIPLYMTPDDFNYQNL